MGNTYCDGTIITKFRIATWNCKIDPLKDFEKVAIYTNRQTVAKNHYFNMPEFATQKIKQPTWLRIDDYYILLLDKPLKISSKQAPICIAKSIRAMDTENKVLYHFEGPSNKLRIAKESELIVERINRISEKLPAFFFPS